MLAIRRSIWRRLLSISFIKAKSRPISAVNRFTFLATKQDLFLTIADTYTTNLFHNFVLQHPKMWTKVVALWLPTGRHLRGKPRKRWCDDLDHFFVHWLIEFNGDLGEAFPQQ